MNRLQMYGTLVLCLLFNIDQAKEVTNRQAIIRCQEKGGLAPSNYFNPVSGTVTYPPKHPDLGVKFEDLNKLSLNDGKSAWVAGFASYSLPVKFIECVVWTENTASEANGSSIYSCLNYCGYKTSTTDSYIGVNSRYCVCLTRHMVEATRARCDPANDTLLGVFEVKRENVKGEFLYQCSNIQLNTSTAKCTEEHNFVCLIKNKEDCTNNTRHYLVNDSGTFYCIVAETKTWLDSVNYCKKISATILPDVLPQLVYEKNALVNDTVGSWVGTFRSFTVSDDRMGNRTCLVVTRVNNKLVLEPEDCKKRRKYVCLENVRRKHGNNKIETTTFGKTTSDISDKVEDNVHNGIDNTTEPTTFGKTTIDSNDTVDDNGYNRTDTKTETTTIGKTTSDISDTVEDNVHNRTRIPDGKNESDSNSLIIGIVITVGAILALFGIAIFFLPLRKICNRTQTLVITDSAKESREMCSVEGEQFFFEIRDSYVELGPEPLNGENSSQSCDGKDITAIVKPEYKDDSRPIRLHNDPKDNLNTNMYSYAQIVHDHVSDGYDICSSASRFRKTGASSNNYDKMDLRDKHIRV